MTELIRKNSLQTELFWVLDCFALLKWKAEPFTIFGILSTIHTKTQNNENRKLLVPVVLKT